MKKIFVAGLLCASVFAPAYAQSSAAAPGPYIGVQASDDYVGILGGYQLDPMFAIEAHYFRLDRVVHNHGWDNGWGNGWGNGWNRHEGDNIGVGVNAKLPLNIAQVPGLSVFGKLGVERTEVEHIDADGRTWQTTSRTEVGLSGGAQYDFDQNFGVRLGLHLAGGPNDLFLTGILKF